MKALVLICLSLASTSFGNRFDPIIDLENLPPVPAECAKPVCNCESDGEILFPHIDPHKYWQCPPGAEEPIERPCAPGTWFSYKVQVCVHCEEWENPCNIDPPPTTSTTQTTTSTTQSSTTQSSTTTSTTQSSTTSSTTESPTSIAGESTPSLPQNCSEPVCDCTSTGNMSYPMPDPYYYWQCAPGYEKPLKRPCPPGTVFSFLRQLCVFPSEWENPCGIPELPCTTASSTTEAGTTAEQVLCGEPVCRPGITEREFFPNIDPTKYWQCIPGYPSALLMSCEVGKLFNNAIRACVHESLWDNVCRVPKPTFKCLEPQCDPQITQIQRYPNPDPTKYWQCIPGFNQALLMPCIDGLKYNNQSQACVDPAQWVDSCSSGETTTPPPWTKPPLPPLTGCGEPSCQGQDYQFLWPHLEPTKFYQCAPDVEKGWSPKIHTCPAGLLFSYQEQVCVWPYQWENPCNVEGPCPPTELCVEPTCNASSTIRQFFPNPDPTKYWQCIPGFSQALLMLCISGNYYNHKLKACVNPTLWDNPCNIDLNQTCVEPTCNPAITTPEFYPNPEPTKYWQCIPGFDQVLIMSCQNGLYYNHALKACADQAIWDNVCKIQQPTCQEPVCDPTITERVFYPNPDPTKYWQCIPGFGQSLLMSCVNQNYYVHKLKACAAQTLWDNVCNVNPVPKCQEPVCDPAITERQFYPNPDRTKYWQCIPGFPEALLTPCITGLWYSDLNKKCVDPAQWEDSCGGKPPVPPLESCEAPVCDCNGTSIGILKPHKEFPGKYWECAPGYDAPFLRDCPANTLFSYKEQVCVFCEQWENPCGIDWTPGSSTTPSTTVSSTATSTTESATSIAGTSPTVSLPPPICGEPICDCNSTGEILYPDLDPSFFWRCAPGHEKPFKMQCPGVLRFSYKWQVCVECSDWENPCQVPEPTGTTSTTQSSTTTPSSTTTQPTSTTSTTQSTSTTSTTRSSTTTESPSRIESTVLPPVVCGEPTCDCNSTGEILYPDLDPSFFWRCAPGHEKPFKMQCPENLRFSYKWQVCVECSEWENPCEVPEPTTQPSTTSTTRSTSTTSTTQSTSTTSTTRSSTTTESPSRIESTVLPPVICGEPICDCNATGEILYPDLDPSFFWRCAPGHEKPFKMQCPGLLRFSYKWQVCVDCDEWENPCNVDPTGTATQTTSTTTVRTTESPSNVQSTLPVLCSEPICDCDATGEILFPARDPSFFWRCAPGHEKPFYMECPANLRFGYNEQTCVDCDLWEDPCSTGVQPEVGNTTTTNQPPTTKAQPEPPAPSETNESTTAKSTTTKKSTTTTAETTEDTQKPTQSSTTKSTDVCAEPECVLNPSSVTLFPAINPNYYWQCIPGRKAIYKLCASGTYFSAKLQVCVHERDWENPCNVDLKEYPRDTTLDRKLPFRPPKSGGIWESITGLFE